MRTRIGIGVAVYVALWFLTGMVGIPQVDRAFDREFTFGSTNGFAPGNASARTAPVTRVPYSRIVDPDQQLLPDVPFRSRSAGVAIAPFVIVDEVCVSQGPLAAFSGRRLVGWLLGFSRWIPLKVWWVS